MAEEAHDHQKQAGYVIDFAAYLERHMEGKAEIVISLGTNDSLWPNKPTHRTVTLTRRG